MKVELLRVPAPMYKLYEYGYPACHEICARNYWCVIWVFDFAERFAIRHLMSLS